MFSLFKKWYFSKQLDFEPEKKKRGGKKKHLITPQKVPKE